MKKDNNTYFYLVDTLYYVKVKKENGEWKAQEDDIRVDGTSEWNI
jgi:hypothetical protein